MKKRKIGRVVIPFGAKPWPHEKRVAKILADAGYYVEFIPEGTIGTADIYLENIIFEIKSPKSNKTNTLEHRLKDAINNQSYNIIVDSSRMKGMTDNNLKNWLKTKYRTQPQIKRLLFIDKKNRIIDISKLI